MRTTHKQSSGLKLTPSKMEKTCPTLLTSRRTLSQTKPNSRKKFSSQKRSAATNSLMTLMIKRKSKLIQKVFKCCETRSKTRLSASLLFLTKEQPCSTTRKTFQSCLPSMMQGTSSNRPCRQWSKHHQLEITTPILLSLTPVISRGCLSQCLNRPVKFTKAIGPQIATKDMTLQALRFTQSKT